MLLDIRKIFSAYDAPIKITESLNLSNEDFPGYEVLDPVDAEFLLVLEGKNLQLSFSFQARVDYECARCLERSQQVFLRESVLFDPGTGFTGSGCRTSLYGRGKIGHA